MANYCPQCGKPADESAQFCPSCGAKMVVPTAPPASVPPAAQQSVLPPEADSILSLNNIAGVIALIIAIIFLLIGVILLIVFIGIIFIVFGVINLLIWNKTKEINARVQKKEYRRAKSDQLAWSVIGLILGGIITGLILLIAYLKYDELIRYEEK